MFPICSKLTSPKERQSTTRYPQPPSGASAVFSSLTTSMLIVFGLAKEIKMSVKEEAAIVLEISLIQTSPQLFDCHKDNS